MTIDYTTWGGDEAQQKRRRAMAMQHESPTYWLNLAERAFIFAMRGTGNVPDKELSNIVGFLVQAAEYGGTVDALSERLTPRIEAEPEPLAEIWRAVAVALETLAQQRIMAHNSAAQIEAIASMEVSPA